MGENAGRKKRPSHLIDRRHIKRTQFAERMARKRNDTSARIYVGVSDPPVTYSNPISGDA